MVFTILITTSSIIIKKKKLKALVSSFFVHEQKMLWHLRLGHPSLLILNIYSLLYLKKQGL